MLVAEVDRETFGTLLQKSNRPMVLALPVRFPRSYKYFMQYGGYLFLTRSKEPVDFSQAAEVVVVKKIHATVPAG